MGIEAALGGVRAFLIEPRQRCGVRSRIVPARGSANTAPRGRLLALLSGLPLAIGVAGLAGCDPIAGLEDVTEAATDPSSVVIERRGVQLVSGEFEQLGTADQGRYGWALANGRLQLLDLTDESSCSVDQVSGFMIPPSRLIGVAPLVVKGPPNERGYIAHRFVDWHCRQKQPPLEGTSFLGGAWSDGLYFSSEEGRLLLVRAGSSGAALVHDAVAKAVVDAGNRPWVLSKSGLLSGPQPISARNPAGVQLGRIDSGVRDFFVLDAAWQKTGEAWLPDVIYETESSIRHGFGADWFGGCRLRSSESGDRVLMDRPCDSERSLLQINSTLWLALPDHIHDVQAAGFTDLEEQPAKPVGVWFVSAASGELGELHTTVMSRDHDPLFDDPPATRLIAVGASCRADWCLLDQRQGRGRLIRIQPSSDGWSLEELASEVSAFVEPAGDNCPTGPLVIRGSANTLTCLGEKPRAIAEGITTPSDENAWYWWRSLEQRTGNSGADGLFLVTDVESGAGTLRLARTDTQGLELAGEAVADDVLAWTAQASLNPPGVVYLTRDHRLMVYNGARGLSFEVSEDVVDYSIVSEPRPGLLYLVAEGERAGVWFARARAQPSAKTLD